MTNRELFRPKSSYIFGFTGVFFFSAFTYASFLEYGLAESVVVITWCALSISLCYQIFLRPAVIFYDEGIEIINPLTRHLIGWHEVEEIQTRFNMSIVTTDRKGKKGFIQAFAAPAPSIYQSRRIHQNKIASRNSENGQVLHASDNLLSHSGAAAGIALSRLQQFRRFRNEAKVAYQFQFNSTAVVINSSLMLIATAALFLKI